MGMNTVLPFKAPLPSEAPVDGRNLAMQACANFEALMLERASPDVALQAAEDILADLYVAELFAKDQKHEELIKASSLLANATRGYARARRDPATDLTIRSSWHTACYELFVLVRKMSKRLSS